MAGAVMMGIEREREREQLRKEDTNDRIEYATRFLAPEYKSAVAMCLRGESFAEAAKACKLSPDALSKALAHAGKKETGKPRIVACRARQEANSQQMGLF